MIFVVHLYVDLAYRRQFEFVGLAKVAKRRKKRNNSSANQPSVPDSVNAASEPLSSTAAATESSSPGSSADNQPVAEAAASKGVNSTGFFQGTKEELEKVVWPDRQQLISESIAVFLMVSLSAFIISFIDNLFRWASQLVFG